VYKGMCKALTKEEPIFPLKYSIKVSISECELDDKGKLLFRGRRWVPNLEVLYTKIIQMIHDLVIGGHPGREVIVVLVMR
jgi:hypothetical protein